MAIDHVSFISPANHGDVAGIAIVVSIALSEISCALDLISKGEKPSEELIARIAGHANRLSETFNDLTGYVP